MPSKEIVVEMKTGTLAGGGQPLVVKDLRPLPASD
jgi:hypothetical protein